MSKMFDMPPPLTDEEKAQLWDLLVRYAAHHAIAAINMLIAALLRKLRSRTVDVTPRRPTPPASKPPIG